MADQLFVDSLVCGTNGLTFGSECQLKQFACRTQKEVKVKREGSCSGKYDIVCQFGFGVFYLHINQWMAWFLHDLSEDESSTPEFRSSRKTTRHLVGNKETTKDGEDFISTPTYGKVPVYVLQLMVNWNLG